MYSSKSTFAAAIIAISVSILSPVWAEQSDVELQFWDFASNSGSIETLEAFISNYPESDYVEEARNQIAGLQDDERRRQMEQMIFDRIGDVKWDVPMSFGNAATIGLSLSEITTTSPMYPPIEGLPEEYWKNANCSSCHQWTREDLCAQANTYIEAKPVRYQEKQHPFGGMLKINMRNWAIGGCQ